MRTPRVLMAVFLLAFGSAGLAACDDQDTYRPPPIVHEEPDSSPYPPDSDSEPYEPAPEPEVLEPAPEPEPDYDDPYGSEGSSGCAFPDDVKCTLTVPGPLLPQW
jgi:hypothetical protein